MRLYRLNSGEKTRKMENRFMQIGPTTKRDPYICMIRQFFFKEFFFEFFSREYFVMELVSGRQSVSMLHPIAGFAAECQHWWT